MKGNDDMKGFFEYESWQASACFRARLRILRTLVVFVALMTGWRVAAEAAVPVWGGSSTNTPQAPMSFQCPKAYLGVRQDLLPTHWEIVAGRVPLRLKASQVQRDELLCTYKDKRGRSMGTVRRLAPEGYKCISDGAGRFRCRLPR